MTLPARVGDIGISPALLKWAREWRGRTIQAAADKVQKDARVIVEWESGLRSPTVTQARKLADFYERPFLEFFLSEPPEVPVAKLVPDYRTHAGTTLRENDRDLQLLQQWAETARLDALELFAELQIETPEFPKQLLATLASHPDEVADQVRELMEFPIHEQIQMTKVQSKSLATLLRRQMENLGVLTLRRPDLKAFGARGICIAEFPLPVVVVQNESSTAQAFTLMHELGHIILRQSAITGPRKRGIEKQPIEYWCDQFAASFLMPTTQVIAFAGPSPDRPAQNISHESLKRLAEVFRVSPHAMLIRLVHLGYVQETYYWGVMKPFFDKVEAEESSGGRSTYYGSRYRSRFGDLYTGLVLEAWASGRITNHTAAAYMGIRRIDHLEDIRREFSLA